MTKRPPTPTGWSDTDWIKKLQDEEENPLGCLHINQGSFDAAADAYEEEYKMSKRTAMDIADALEVEMPTLKNLDDAAAAAVNTEREAIEAIVRALPNPHDGLTLGSVIRAIRARSAT